MGVWSPRVLVFLTTLVLIIGSVTLLAALGVPKYVDAKNQLDAQEAAITALRAQIAPYASQHASL